jgi:trehalose 6-phosphate synthase/phosphatase
MRLVLVSYRLPFRVVRGRLTQNAGGLVSAMLSLVNSSEGIAAEIEEIVWIGASNDTAEELANARKSGKESLFKLVPIQIPDKIDQPFYSGFCNDLIWPLFHYFPSISNFEEKNWQAYTQANSMFCDALQEIVQPTDRIWVHDYHFMLLPAMIRKRLPDAQIGFFLHTPFPSFEVVRQIPRTWLQEMLIGVLGANLVGFHTYDYVQYFNGTVQRTLGYGVSGGWIHSQQQATWVEAFPIGIDALNFRQELSSRRTDRERQKIRAAIGDRIMMFSVDRMDYSKGLVQRIEAVELFFREHPEWRGAISNSEKNSKQTLEESTVYSVHSIGVQLFINIKRFPRLKW